MAKEELTPMMRQFHDMKASNPDAILLFRCGAFYETYCEEAVIASVTKTGCAVTAEEHSVVGGLGSAGSPLPEKNG